MFDSLADLAERWRVSSSDIRQWLIGGTLTAVVWLPVMSVSPLGEEPTTEEGRNHLRHWEGYIQISKHQCRRIFRQERIPLREFTAHDQSERFRLPETSDDLIVELGDLVVLESERKRFEAAYPALGSAAPVVCNQQVPPKSEAVSGRAYDPTYRIVRMEDGREYRFGETQAKVLRLLADATRQGEPWQNGKTLLHGAGSQSFSLSNLFKRHPVWRELVISNGRGFYRMCDRFIREVEQFG